MSDRSPPAAASTGRPNGAIMRRPGMHAPEAGRGFAASCPSGAGTIAGGTANCRAFELFSGTILPHAGKRSA